MQGEAAGWPCGERQEEAPGGDGWFRYIGESDGWWGETRGDAAKLSNLYPLHAARPQL